MTRRAIVTATFIVAIVSCRGAEGGNPGAPVKAVPALPSQPPISTEEVTSEHYKMPPLPRARVTVSDAFGGKHPVDSEVCATRAARTRGLMWRTSLEEGKGMIFFFPEEQEVSFWMKNTLIPLDMIFITAGRRVAGCVENAEPQTLSPRGVNRPSQMVLEVPAGWCTKMGIRAGSAVTIEGVDGLRVYPD